MKRTPKGSFGYIAYARKMALLRTAVCFSLCAGFFLAGRLLTGSNRNALSIVAAVLSLPTGLFAVNLIMFLRAKPCPAHIRQKIEAARGLLPVRYDLTFTSGQGDYPVAAAVCLPGHVCCFTTEEKLDVNALKKHLKLQMALGKYHELSIEVMKDADAFCDRLRALDALRAENGYDPQGEEERWVPGTPQTMTGILESVSL